MPIEKATTLERHTLPVVSYDDLLESSTAWWAQVQMDASN